MKTSTLLNLSVFFGKWREFEVGHEKPMNRSDVMARQGHGRETGDRFAAGILAAWATEMVVSFIVGCMYVLSIGGGESRHLSGLGEAIFLIAGIFVSIGAVVGLIASLVLGVPILKLFVRYGFTSRLSFLGAGTIISAALGSVFYISHQFGEKMLDIDFHFAMLAVFLSGPLAGLSFWLVNKRV